MRVSFGYSILELLITLSVLSITATVGMPTFINTVNQSDADSSSQRIYRAWQHARSQALTQAKTLTLCGSNDGLSCITPWQNQLILFNDINGDHEPSEGEIIFNYPVEASRGSIQSRISFGRKYTQITQEGRSSLTGSFLYCSNTTEPIERKITWNQPGRPYYTGTNRNYTTSSSVHCE